MGNRLIYILREILDEAFRNGKKFHLHVRRLLFASVGKDGLRNADIY